jgi:hypothetical protein
MNKQTIVVYTKQIDLATCKKIADAFGYKFVDDGVSSPNSESVSVLFVTSCKRVYGFNFMVRESHCQMVIDNTNSVHIAKSLYDALASATWHQIFPTTEELIPSDEYFYVKVDNRFKSNLYQNIAFETGYRWDYYRDISVRHTDANYLVFNVTKKKIYSASCIDNIPNNAKYLASTDVFFKTFLGV